MVKIKKVSVYFAVVLVLVISSLRTPNLQSSPEHSNSYVLDYLNNSPLYNRSLYLNFTGSPITFNDSNVDLYYMILIDDTNPDFNWSKTATENEWCTGSGTFSDPYVIEGLYIDAKGVGGGIRIKNSLKYFVIQNCWITNTVDEEWGEGVLIQYTSNGIVRDNIFKSTTTGVSFRYDIYKINVSNNIMIEDSLSSSRGIKVGANVFNSTIADNKMLNFATGMSFHESNDLRIYRNFMENTWRDFSKGGSVVFLSNCDDSFVVGNILAGTFATGSITVAELNSGQNVVEYNYVSTNQSLAFDFNISLSGVDDKLYQSQTSGVSFDLTGSFRNYIAYNIMLMDSPDGNGNDNGNDNDNGTGSGGIPGFDPILIVGVISIVTLVLLKKRMRK